MQLDAHRGMVAQKDTEMRRGEQEVRADQAALRERQEELERFLFTGAATGLAEAAAKARYLLELFAAGPDGQDPRRRTMIAGALDDLERFSTGIAFDPTRPTGSAMQAWFVPPIVIPIGLVLAIVGYASFVYFH